MKISNLISIVIFTFIYSTANAATCPPAYENFTFHAAIEEVFGFSDITCLYSSTNKKLNFKTLNYSGHHTKGPWEIRVPRHYSCYSKAEECEFE